MIWGWPDFKSGCLVGCCDDDASSSDLAKMHAVGGVVVRKVGCDPVPTHVALVMKVWLWAAYLTCWGFGIERDGSSLGWQVCGV